MKKHVVFFTLIIMASIMVAFTSCTKNNDAPEIVQDIVQDVKGFAQKGPFISGSSITVYDLNPDLSPSGKSFNSEIADNKGAFQLKNLSLSSNFVRLRADGFYFNEVLGQPSAAQITLYALSDLTDTSEVNINLLTHLEKPRVEYLMKEGKSFEDSKMQAQKEVLAIFNMEKENIKTSEKLNISEDGDDNGILLAISSIIQGYHSESQMTELLSNLRNDLLTDGILNSDTLGSELINQALALDTVAIRNNLTKRYREIGATAKVPDFGKYVANFIAKTKFKSTRSIINYPKTGLNGPNLLALNDTVYTTADYSLAANLPKGTSLRIVITALDQGGIWFIRMGSEINWSITSFTGKLQTFTAINSDSSCDLHMVQFARGRYLIEYFEKGYLAPTRKKIIKI
ncbi:MAG TPA: hypothetical protein DCL77_04475 [Prolixibacteraceae bacterium]|jgi:hypothetical protein|nr:hypothetical protein [Prolixibacteraceae bacterium]